MKNLKFEEAGFEFFCVHKNNDQIPTTILIRFANYYLTMLFHHTNDNKDGRSIHVSMRIGVGIGCSAYLYVCMNVIFSDHLS